MYALVHSALYGKPYVYAAMDTVHLIRQCGLSTLIHDSLINPLLLMTSIVGGCIIGMCCLPLSRVFWVWTTVNHLFSFFFL